MDKDFQERELITVLKQFLEKEFLHDKFNSYFLSQVIDLTKALLNYYNVFHLCETLNNISNDEHTEILTSELLEKISENIGKDSCD